METCSRFKVAGKAATYLFSQDSGSRKQGRFTLSRPHLSFLDRIKQPQTSVHLIGCTLPLRRRFHQKIYMPTCLVLYRNFCDNTFLCVYIYIILNVCFKNDLSIFAQDFISAFVLHSGVQDTFSHASQVQSKRGSLSLRERI